MTSLKPFIKDSQSTEFSDRKLLVQRAILTRDLTSPLDPRQIMAWCEWLDMPLPDDLQSAIRQRKSEPFLSSEGAAGLLRLVERERQSKPFGTRERQNMLLAITCMGIDKFGFKLGSQRQEATSKIVSAIERQGVSLHSDTVLKYLQQGAELINERRANNPNSD